MEYLYYYRRCSTCTTLRVLSCCMYVCDMQVKATPFVDINSSTLIAVAFLFYLLVTLYSINVTHNILFKYCMPRFFSFSKEKIREYCVSCVFIAFFSFVLGCLPVFYLQKKQDWAALSYVFMDFFLSVFSNYPRFIRTPRGHMLYCQLYCLALLSAYSFLLHRPVLPRVTTRTHG